MPKIELDRTAIIARSLEDPVYWCRTFLSHWFPRPMPWFHKALLAVLLRKVKFLENDPDLPRIKKHFVLREDPLDLRSHGVPIFYHDSTGKLCLRVLPNTAWMIPRGFSKTTLCNAANLYKIVHGLKNFLLYVSESGTHAEMQVGNLKNELEQNEMILAVYGELRGPKWTEAWMETQTGITVVGRGRGAQIRGLLRQGNRPDDITIDDMEDEESVRTPEQRQKALAFLTKAVIPARKKSPEATITMLGTLLHKEAVLMVMAKDPRFNFFKFGARDTDGKPIWPDHMGERELEVEKKAAARTGTLAAYYMEYESELRDDETAKFKQVVYSQPGEILSIGIAVDPAISDDARADYFAIAAVAMGEKGQIHVLDCWGGKGITPREQVDRSFEFYKRFAEISPNIRFGVEAISYQRALVHLIREEMFRKGTYFDINEIKHGRVAKIERVEGVLQPRYANGYIHHAKPLPLLEEQLYDWPNGKLDFPDAVAMAVTLLDPYAAAAAGDRDLSEDEYEPLQMEYGAP